MAETTVNEKTGSRGSASPAVKTDAEREEIRRLLVEIGGAMNASGQAVNEISVSLRRIALAYGVKGARIIVVPTFLAIALGPAEQPVLEETRQQGGKLRLDQTANLFKLVDQAEKAEVSPREGIRKLHEIVASKPRFGARTTILGHVILTVGICLVLRSTPADLVLAAILGALVGVLNQLSQERATMQVVTPVVASILVSAITILLIRHDVGVDLTAIIAPLVTFLPGAALCMGTIEIAAGEVVAGSSRLVSGSLLLLILAFGILAGSQLVGSPTHPQLVRDFGELMARWTPWLGVAVFGFGAWIYFSGPSLWWLMVVLYAAWIGQVLGNELFGGYLSAFSGALVMTPVAYSIDRYTSGPPALVTFLPAFWLLVPGALGLIGVTELIGSGGSDTSINSLIGSFVAVAGIAVGVLCGYSIFRSATLLGTRIQQF